MSDKPGIKSEIFTIQLDKSMFGLDESVDLIIGTDIELSEPVQDKDGWSYQIKDLTGKLTEALKKSQR